jgi:2-phosphosulfolactate phosphatase
LDVLPEHGRRELGSALVGPAYERNIFHSMNIERATLETCHEATDTVVVIDVLRAFTTAAYAFAAGAVDIRPVATVEEALALRAQNPGWLVMGEVGGRPVAGFDFGNSPAAFLGVDMSGRHLVQRTSAGTQGVMRSRNARRLLVASLVVARATAETIRRHAPETVTLVITGARQDRSGDEDAACADYLEALLAGAPVDREAIMRRVRQAWAGRLFTRADPDFPAADLECALDIDRFNFALEVRRREGLHVIEPVISVQNQMYC